MTTSLLLWAAGFADLMPFLIAVIVAVLSILVQYLRNAAGGQKPQQGPQPANSPQPPARPRPQPQQQIDEEIGEFLRRAAQRRGGPQAGQPVVVPPAREQPVQAVVVAERPVGGDVDRHVKRYLDKREFEQRTQQLGAEVAPADDKVEAHLRGKFDHRISSVGAQRCRRPIERRSPSRRKPRAATTPAPGDTALVSLLTNPDNIREAIILTEILRRPEERW